MRRAISRRAVTPIVILAGGKSSRMGRDKPSLEYRGETLLLRAIRRFSAEFERVYISAGDTLSGALPPGLEIVHDLLPGLGPISGLHAALSRFNSVFLTAVDMPLAQPRIAREIIEQLRGYDAAAAVSDGRAEPLFAAYSKSILPEVERAISLKDYSLHRLLSRARTLYIDIPTDTLLNINYPEDYARLSHSE